MVAAPRRPVDVVLVEDHELLAQSLGYALSDRDLQAVIAPSLEAGDLLELVRDLRPRLVLLDLDLGEHGSSLPLIDRCVELETRVLMLTAVTDRARLASCIEAGAVGVVAKAQPLGDLVCAIAAVIEQGSAITEAQRQEWLAELRQHRSSEAKRLEPFERLTAREAQVLTALLDGWAAERIAEEWVVSITTVRSQIRSILLKLGVNSQLQAVAEARRAGWSPPSSADDGER